MDDDQLGEFAYDYVEVRRDYLAWTPAKEEPARTESNVLPGDRHGIPQHSEMIQGENPEVNGSGNGSGTEHTGVMGDRHGVAAEDAEKKKLGANGMNGTNGA